MFFDYTSIKKQNNLFSLSLPLSLHPLSFSLVLVLFRSRCNKFLLLNLFSKKKLEI